MVVETEAQIEQSRSALSKPSPTPFFWICFKPLASSHSLSLSLNSDHGLKWSNDNNKKINGLMIFKVYTLLTKTLKKKKKKEEEVNTLTTKMV